MTGPAADLLLEDLDTAGRLEGVALQLGVLSVGGHAGEADEVVRHPASVSETVAEQRRDTADFETGSGRIGDRPGLWSAPLAGGVLWVVCGGQLADADDQGAGGGFDDVVGDGVELVDLQDALDLGEEAFQEPEVPASDAGDGGD